MRRVRRFLSLAPGERSLLVRALWRLSRTCLKLHLLSQDKWQTLLAPVTAPATTPRQSFSEDQIAWAVRAAARYVPAANCLPQAIVAKQLLEEQGYHPVLRIGVQPPEALDLKAHAWVECGGRILVGDGGHVYQPLGAAR